MELTENDRQIFVTSLNKLDNSRAKEIIQDYILNNKFLDNQKKAELETQVEKILGNYCGETGENEGLISTLERKLKENKQLNQKITDERQLISWIIKDIEDNPNYTREEILQRHKWLLSDLPKSKEDKQLEHYKAVVDEIQESIDTTVEEDGFKREPETCCIEIEQILKDNKK